MCNRRVQLLPVNFTFTLPGVMCHAGVNTFFGRAAALINSTNNVANIQKIMTKIGAMCLITIGAWVVIQLGVQFGAYKHSCALGEGQTYCGSEHYRVAVQALQLCGTCHLWQRHLRATTEHMTVRHTQILIVRRKLAELPV
jgi:hypothetical protein